MDIVSHYFHAESCDIHPNHGDLLGAIWSWAGIKAEHRQKVAELLSMMGPLHPQSSQRKLKWAVIWRQLLQGELLLYLQCTDTSFCGEFWLFRGFLALDELSDLCSYLRVWRIEEHVYIDALMPPTESFHRHLFFQRTNPPCAVGASLALETIIQHSPIAFKSISYRNESCTSFLVCSRGGGGLLHMELVAELWEENIEAQLVPTPDPSLREQYEYASKHDTKGLVIITDSGAQTGFVKVRHLDLKREKEVERENLVSFLLEAISTQFRKPFLWN